MKTIHLWGILILFLGCLSLGDLHQNERTHIKGRVRKRNSRNFSFRPHNLSFPMCPFNTTIIDNTEILLATIEASKFIFTGKVLSLTHSPRGIYLGNKKDRHIYKIFIRRVLKGDINELNHDVHFEANTKKNFNGATVYVARDRPEGENCEPSPRVRYSAIFLAERDEDDRSDDEEMAHMEEHRPRPGNLRLVVDPVPLSLYHLDRVNAAVKGAILFMVLSSIDVATEMLDSAFPGSSRAYAAFSSLQAITLVGFYRLSR